MKATGTREATQESCFPDIYESVAEASPMPVAVVAGASGVVRYVNPAFCRLVGKTRQEVVGSLFFPIVPDGDELPSLLDRVHQTKEALTHTGNDHPPSRGLYWSYAVWPVFTRAAAGDDVASQVTGDIVVQVIETTPFHHQVAAMNEALMIGSVRQHELTEAADTLNRQLEAEIIERNRAEELLQRANRDLKDFSSVASHDLQEPLRTVSLYTQLLARKLGADLDPETEKFIEYIVDGSARMRTLIKDLLAYAEIGAESLQSVAPVDCGEALAGALANLQGAIEETHASIAFYALPQVNSNLRQLTQVFENLIGNALKYIKPDGSPRIQISAERQGDEWIISVLDNGIGFDPQYSERIFGVFERLHRRQFPGTGIGLAICKRIVERYGGRIWAAGEEGKGATFFFTMSAVGPSLVIPDA
jgi:signal transduction histidine kinase